MLDLAFNVLNTWGPLGNLKQVPLGGSSAQQWANSSYSIIYGSSTNWILGFGRSTNILGPDTKWVMDWNELWNLIPIGSSKSAGNYFKAIGVGAVGSTDLIIGPKNALNYGVQDISVTSKKKKSISITYSDVVESKEKIGKIRIAILVIGSLVTIGANVLARIVFMSEALSSSATTRQLTQNGLQVGSNFLTPRMISLLTVLEVAFDCVDALKMQAKDAAERTALLKTEAKDATEASKNLIISDLNNGQSAPLIQPRISRSASLVAEQMDIVLQDSQALIQEIQVPSASKADFDQLRDKVLEIERSTLDLVQQRASYALAASNGPIRFNIANDEATMTLSPSADGGNARISATNSAVLNAINSVEVESARHVALRVTDDGSSQNNLTLDGTNITLQCGAAATGPSFTMNGADKTLTIQQGGQFSPAKIEVKDKNVVISSMHLMDVGSFTAQPQEISIRTGNLITFSSLKMTPNSFSLCANPLVEILAGENSIELSVGPSKITITPTDITLEAVNVKINAQMISGLETMIDKKVAQAMAQSQAPLEKKDAGSP